MIHECILEMQGTAAHLERSCYSCASHPEVIPSFLLPSKVLEQNKTVVCVGEPSWMCGVGNRANFCPYREREESLW